MLNSLLDALMSGKGALGMGVPQGLSQNLMSKFNPVTGGAVQFPNMPGNATNEEMMPQNLARNPNMEANERIGQNLSPMPGTRTNAYPAAHNAAGMNQQGGLLALLMQLLQAQGQGAGRQNAGTMSGGAVQFPNMPGNASNEEMMANLHNAFRR